MNELKRDIGYIKESYKLWLSGLFDFNSDEPLFKYNRIQSVAKWTIAIPSTIILLILMAISMDYDFDFNGDIWFIVILIFLIAWFLTISSHIRRFKFRQKNYISFLIVSLICYIVGFTLIQIFHDNSWKYLIGLWILFIPNFITSNNAQKSDRDELYERVENHE